MRKMELNWKMGGEWIPEIGRKSGLLKLGGPVLNKELFATMKLNEARIGDITKF
jgi:hypothetical protein